MRYNFMLKVSQCCCEIKYCECKIFADKKFIISKSIQMLGPDYSCARLLAVAPGHGSVHYVWEKKDVVTLKWVSINVPTDTCLLYARSMGYYKCEVEGRVFTYEVKGSYTALGLAIIMLCSLYAQNNCSTFLVIVAGQRLSKMIIRA